MKVNDICGNPAINSYFGVISPAQRVCMFDVGRMHAVAFNTELCLGDDVYCKFLHYIFDSSRK